MHESASDGSTVEQEVQKSQIAATALGCVPSVTRLPRPSVRKRSTASAKTFNDGDSIVGAIRMSMLQEPMRREEQHCQRILDKEDDRVRREERSRIREEKRAEEREIREEDRQCNDGMTQITIVALLGRRGDDIMK